MAAPAGVGQRLGHHVPGVGAEGARDLHHVGELALLQAQPELADLPVGGVGQDHRRSKAPGGQLVQHLQRQLPLGAVALALGHVGLAAPLGVAIPLLGQKQPPVQRAAGLVGGGVHAHADLAVGHLAKRPAVLRRHADRPAAELREGGVVDHPRGWGDRGGHALGEAAAHRRRVPGGLVDELLQRLLQRVGVRVGVAAGQPGGHGLDRLALAVQQQPAQVALAPAALVLARDGLEEVLGEGGQAGADAAKLCGCHGVPPAAVACSFRLGALA